ncbi:MAG: pyroglutamyl-peptidase I [Rhizobiaceae bacterium]
MTADRPRLLVTGFNAFPGAPVNPTEALVADLLEHRAAIGTRCHMHAEVLEVDYRALPSRLATIADGFRPDIAIHFGLSASARGFRLERHARNCVSLVTADNAGHIPSVATICDGGEAHDSTLPLQAIHDRLAATGIPVEWSDSAGDYLCNYLFYHARGGLVEGYAPLMAGFIHVPPFPGEPARIESAPFAIDRATLLRGAQIVIDACLDAWSDF